MNKQLSYLTSLFGASGSEGDVRQAILHEIREYCESVRVDRLGNIIAFKRGAIADVGPIMLCAHMDEIALMVTYITSDGNLKFDTVGGIDSRILPGKHVVIGRRKLHGVIGVKAPHLVKDESKPLKAEELYIDIGAKDREDAERVVSVGDMVGFESDYREFGDGLVRAKALDDRAGCYAMIELIKKELPVDAWFVFTTMEEIGCIGATVASYALRPRYALILEGTTAGDIHSDPNQTEVCRVGNGPVISFMDNGAIYDREFYRIAMEAAAERGLPVQTTQAVAGGNESSAVQRSFGGCKVLAVSVPCRYIHSPVSVASLADIENTVCLVQAILNKLL